MKKVIVTFGVFIVWGTVWTLFLEREKRRFVDSLPKVPTTVTQPVDATSPPAVDAETDSATPVPSPWMPIVENPTPANGTEMGEALDEDVQDFTVEEMIELFEGALAETQGPQHDDVKNSFEEFLASQGITREEYEKQEIARETLQRILSNPANVLVGQPLEVGAVYVMSASRQEELLKAAIVLDPSEGNQRALERIRRRVKHKTIPEPGPETDQVIQIDGFTIDFPR